MKKYFICLLIFVISILACSKAQPISVIDESVKSYLDKILETMKLNSLNRNKTDWETFYKNVYAKAKNAKSIYDQTFYESIVLALNQLEDSHSFFITNSGKYLSSTGANCTFKTYATPALPSTIGYIKIPGFSGSSMEANAFAEQIQNEIKKQDNSKIIGWIVDLRSNTGGNMWPMVSGISPLLGDGIIGFFIDNENVTSAWELKNGSAGGILISNPYKLLNIENKIAVLTDQATASSGEATAIAFRGKSNTKSFGVSTCGLSTANQGFNYADGSKLFLTVSIMADRNKKIYGKSILPDVVEADAEKQLQLAVNWILN